MGLLLAFFGIENGGGSFAVFLCLQGREIFCISYEMDALLTDNYKRKNLNKDAKGHFHFPIHKNLNCLNSRFKKSKLSD